MKESTGESVEELENEVEEGERRLRDNEIECEERVVSRGFSKVYIPNKIEFEAHCRTHVPYRSWCPICAQAKKRNPPHVTAKMGDHRGTPVISMDYTFLNNKVAGCGLCQLFAKGITTATPASALPASWTR